MWFVCNSVRHDLATQTVSGMLQHVYLVITEADLYCYGYMSNMVYKLMILYRLGLSRIPGSWLLSGWVNINISRAYSSSLLFVAARSVFWNFN